nr:MAG TPA: hypothetical protein [Caudoviricetes sp.]
MLLFRWSTSVDHHLFFYFFEGIYGQYEVR